MSRGMAATAERRTDGDHGPPYSGRESSNEIQSDIAETRRHMDDTLERLGDRLHPRTLLDDFLDVFRGGNDEGASTKARERVRDAGTRIAETIKNHPTSSLLIGAGLAWMLYEKRRDDIDPDDVRAPDLREYSGSFVDARTGEPYDDSYGEEWRREVEGESRGGGTSMGEKARGAAEAAKAKGRSLAEKSKEGAGRAAGAVRSAAGAVGGAVRGAASHAASRARGFATTAGRRSSHMARRVGDRVSSAVYEGRDRARYAFDEHPLAVGAGALALGIVAGLLIPRTRREDELMGEEAEGLRERARDKGAELVERGKEVARATVETATEEAERQGLMPHELADKAARVSEATKEAAHEEGVTPADLAEKAKKVAESARDTAKEKAEEKRGSARRPKHRAP